MFGIPFDYYCSVSINTTIKVISRRVAKSRGAEGGTRSKFG